jgi:hypothetical protein
METAEMKMKTLKREWVKLDDDISIFDFTNTNQSMNLQNFSEIIQSPAIAAVVAAPPPLTDAEITQPLVLKRRRQEATRYRKRVEMEMLEGVGIAEDLDSADRHYNACQLASQMAAVERVLPAVGAAAVAMALQPHFDAINAAAAVAMALQPHFDAINARFDILNAKFDILNAKFNNRLAKRLDDPIEWPLQVPIIVGNVLIPAAPLPVVAPPATRRGLLVLTGPACQLWLNYYRLPLGGALEANRTRLAHFLGLPPVQ